jgi:hypothetical protein
VSALLLEDVARFVRRFVVMSDVQADAVALWIAHTHAIEAAETTPYLAITSAEKRSGKSRLGIEVLQLVVREPLPSMNISDAALFRAVAKLKPTLLLDEADAVFKAREREDLRGLLNAGYRRGAVAYRMGGANKTTLESFPVFCAKAFIGIGDFLPDTLVDRSIPIRLERRTREEQIERFTRRDIAPEGEILRDRLADWVEPQLDYLAGLRPELPDELDDRARDSWEPLLAIADLAGGDWPTRARQAAGVLSADEGGRDNDSHTAQLLRDIHSVFIASGAEAFKTADLLERLHAIEESPWGEWHAKPLSSHGLSKLLQPHRIKTMSVRIGEGVGRGYKREQFANAFARVLGVTSVTSVTPKSLSQSDVTPVTLVTPPHENGHIPRLGDPDYLDGLAEVHRSGLVTTAEALELEQLHRLVLDASGEEF